MLLSGVSFTNLAYVKRIGLETDFISISSW